MDPMLPPDADEPTRATSIAAVRTEDHVVWSEGDRNLLGRIEPSFVIASWALCVLAALAVAAVSGAIVALISDRNLLDGSPTELGVITILAAMGTFIGFAIVMTLRLVRVEHDRLSNALAVAALHLVVAGALALVGIFIDGAPDALVALERSAAAAFVACGLAVGMVPAMGGRPLGTQTDQAPTERQL